MMSASRSRLEGVKVKRVTVTVERTMELPDEVELVDLGEYMPTALAVGGRYFFPFDLVWEEWDSSGSAISIVEDDNEVEDLLCPAGSETTMAITIEQVD